MISIVHLLFYAMMYLTRIAGIETRNHEYSNRYPRMYLTRVAGMLLRLPCKAVRNANMRAGHAPPATYRKAQPDG